MGAAWGYPYAAYYYILDNLFYRGALTAHSLNPTAHHNAFDGTALSGLLPGSIINHNAFINTTGFSSTDYGNLTSQL